jgi:prepilin-type N-terminal cleavage/methylation domain-containing protein
MTERRQLRGFTLLELLVATTVLSLMAVMLMQVLHHTSAAWLLGQAQTERRQSARALGDSIAQELQSALMPLDPADQKSLQFTLNPAAVPADLRHPDALFWQAPIATDRSLGDVAEVGYFLKWDETNASNPRPLLCRFFVNPTDADYLIVKNPEEWLGVEILDRVAPADNQGSNGYAGLFAENVIGFWVRCYDEIGNRVEDYDSRVTRKLPRKVKVFLVLIGPDSLPRLSQKPDYSTAGTADEPDLEAFINALPAGVRETARSSTTEVHLQNAQ